MFDDAYSEYQLRRKSFFRRIARSIYLNQALKYVKGRAIDFGCGAGELLGKLPSGSIGLDINQAIVDHCLRKNLNARLYNPDADDYKFSGLGSKTYNTFIMSHVLEHMENPGFIFKKILNSCGRLGIERIIVIVPGVKGFKHDVTHKFFIERSFFINNIFLKNEGYYISKLSYFPFNARFAGNFFTYNEMAVICDKN